MSCPYTPQQEGRTWCLYSLMEGCAFYWHFLIGAMYIYPLSTMGCNVILCSSKRGGLFLGPVFIHSGGSYVLSLSLPTGERCRILLKRLPTVGLRFIHGSFTGSCVMFPRSLTREDVTYVLHLPIIFDETEIVSMLKTDMPL